MENIESHSQLNNVLSPENPRTIKNILTPEEMETCLKAIDGGRWVFTGSSGMSARRFWYMELKDDPFFSDTIFQKIKRFVGEDNIEASRIYANGQTFGLDSDFHADGCDLTFLMYVSPIRTHNVNSICGHTQFKFSNADIIFAVEPLQNTAVLFDGNTLHRGMAPSRDSNMLRVSIAWKINRVRR